MINLFFAAEGSSGIGALGISVSAFVIQLITFILVFLVLMKFAFKPIIKMLEDRRQTIEEGVKAGERLSAQKAKFENQMAKELRQAREEADHIIATGQKEAREVVREAEKSAHRKADSILADAEVRINEEQERAKRALEKDIVGLVSEATEAIVGEKIDPKKDAAVIDKILKEHIKK